MKRILLLLSIIAVLVVGSGCVNNTSKSNPITTQEFDLKVSSFEVYPQYIQEGSPFVLKFFITNEGSKDVKLTNLDISVEAPCRIDEESLRVYPEHVYSSVDNAYHLPAGSMIVIKAEGMLQVTTPKGSCKGVLLYTYEDLLDVIKYVAVVNERELASMSDAMRIKPTELRSTSKQLSAKVQVEEPVIVNENNAEFSVNVILKNEGDGDISIKKEDLRKITADENLKLDSENSGCSLLGVSDDEFIILKPGASIQMSCKFRLMKIPSIREDYRIGLRIPYVVRFGKEFEIKFKKTTQNGVEYYSLDNLLTGRAFSLNLDVGKLLREGIDPGSVGKEMLKDVGKAFLKEWLVENTGIIVKDFSEGVDAYTKEYYAPRYGTKDGKIFAQIRSKSLAKRIFEGRCTKDPDLLEIESECCENLAALKDQGKCDEIINYIYEEGCIDRIIYVERDRINEKVIEPAIEQNSELIKRDLEKAIRKSIQQDKSKFKEIYMPWVREHLSRSDVKSNIVGDGKIVINTRFDGLVEVITETIVTEILVEELKKHKIPIAISSFEKGYKNGFWTSYEKTFATQFPLDAYNACRGEVISKYV